MKLPSIIVTETVFYTVLFVIYVYIKVDHSGN
jgi:hypothetical protein